VTHAAAHLEVDCVVAIQVNVRHDALQLTISHKCTLATQACTQ
jgi:hypothetical protein